VERSAGLLGVGAGAAGRSSSWDGGNDPSAGRPPSSARAARPIDRSTGSRPLAHRSSSARSGSFLSSAAGVTRRPARGVLDFSPFSDSSRADGAGGSSAGVAGVARQRRTSSRHVGLVATRRRSMRPRACSRLRQRWTVPGQRPTRAPIDASDGQQTALPRHQNSRARSTAFSVGLIAGSPAMKCGRLANGSDIPFTGRVDGDGGRVVANIMQGPFGYPRAEQSCVSGDRCYNDRRAPTPSSLASGYPWFALVVSLPASTTLAES